MVMISDRSKLLQSFVNIRNKSSTILLLVDNILSTNEPSTGSLNDSIDKIENLIVELEDFKILLKREYRIAQQNPKR